MNGILSAQDRISLFNPSFEDYPRMSKQPRGWLDCGAAHFNGETPPDTQPGTWGVSLKASDGGSYLGMVVRDIETWESVGQRLLYPIQGGKCYSFSIDLCRSNSYNSTSQKSGVMSSYTKPAVIRIWGSNNYCDTQELLAESSAISNTDWEKYHYKFEPSNSHNYIIFEIFYKTPTLFPYNGNLLIDNASDIVLVPCDKIIPEKMEEEVEEIVAVEEPQRVNQPKPNRTKPVEEKPVQVEEPKPAPPVKQQPKKEEIIVATPPKILKDLKIDRVKQGQVIRIKDLNFEA
ncbi:MAG: OmpA family protein, partial [Bacteroidota bacterium]